MACRTSRSTTLCSRQHIIHGGRIPLPAPRRLHAPCVQGVRYLPQRGRPRLPYLTNDRQHVGSMVIGYCLNGRNGHLTSLCELGTTELHTPRLGCCQCCFVRAPIIARSFSASAANR